MAQVVNIPHAIDEKGSYDDSVNNSEPYTVPSLDVDITIKPEKAGRRNSVSAESYGQDDSDFDDDNDDDSKSSHSRSNSLNNNNSNDNNNSKQNGNINSKNNNENNNNSNQNNNNNNSTNKNDSNTNNSDHKKNDNSKHNKHNNDNKHNRNIRKYKQKHFIRKVYPKTKGAIGRINASVSDLFLWNGLDNEQQKLLIDAMFEKKVSKNESIITQGDRGDYFYVIESGFYEVWKSEVIKGLGGNSKLGVMNEAKKVFEYDNKGSFGELALMYNSPRAATVKAKTEGILWAVDRKTFRHIIVGSTARKRHRYDKFLRKLKIFNNISDTTKSQIADILEGFEFKKGDIIIEQGSNNCTKFYLIQYGTANVVIQTNDGKSHIVSTLREGDFFGERALLLDNVRSASVIVTSKSFTCCAMDKASFARLMDGLDEQFYVKMESYTYKNDFEDSSNNINGDLADIDDDQD